MKKALLFACGSLLVLVVAAVSFLLLKRPASRPAPVVTVHADAARLARGEYVVRHVAVCLHCHSDTDSRSWGNPILAGTEGSGGECLDRQTAFPGRVCARNITADPTTGVGQWKDGELMRAIREGVDRNGDALFMVMPYENYRHMSDEDVEAVVAYLRTLRPVVRKNPERVLDFPLPIITKFQPKPLEGPVSAPNPAEHLAYGKYLVEVAGCEICHTPVDDHHEPLPGQAFSGGQKFLTRAGTQLMSANITPDQGTGIGALDKAQFIGLFKMWAPPARQHQPIDPKLNTVMPWLDYSGMTEDDLGAIYDYLRTVRPIKHLVEAFPHPAPEPVPVATTSGPSPASP